MHALREVVKCVKSIGFLGRCWQTFWKMFTPLTRFLGRRRSFLKNEKHSLLISVDGVKPNDYTVYGSMGLEYGWQDLAFVRMGTHLNHDTAGLSLGAGANIRLGRMALTVDYAFVDYDILKYTNQIAIGLKF